MAAEGGSSGGVDVGVGEKGEHTHTQLGPAAAPGGADASRDATTDTASGGAGSDTRREVRDQAAEVALWHEYAADARSEDAALQLKGVTALRESLERNSETLSRFDASTARGPLGCLTRFFSEEFDHLSPLQREAALALSFGVVMMVQDDDVPKAVLGNLVRLSKSGADVELRGACVMCLARSCCAARDLCHWVANTPSAVDSIVATCMDDATPPEALRVCAQAFLHVADRQPLPPRVVGPLVSGCAYLLRATTLDTETQTLIVQALEKIDWDAEDRDIDRIVDAGVVTMLVEMLNSEDAAVVLPAVQCVGSIAAGSEGATQAVLDAGVLRVIPAALKHQVTKVRAKAAFLCSNICAGNEDQCRQLVEHPHCLRLIVGALGHDEWRVRIEAVWVVSNAALKGFGEELAKAGAVEPLVLALRSALDRRNHLVMDVAVDAVQAMCALDTGLRSPLADLFNSYAGEFARMAAHAGMGAFKFRAMLDTWFSPRTLEERTAAWTGKTLAAVWLDGRARRREGLPSRRGGEHFGLFQALPRRAFAEVLGQLSLRCPRPGTHYHDIPIKPSPGLSAIAHLIDRR